MHQKPGNALNSPPKASYLGADLVAALPGLDVDDLAHGEVLLVGVAKSSLGRESGAAVFSWRATRSNWNDGDR